jgi:hypothetical protein
VGVTDLAQGALQLRRVDRGGVTIRVHYLAKGRPARAEHLA